MIPGLVFATFLCSAPGCTATHDISRASFSAHGTDATLRSAGWGFERQRYDTKHLWYCPIHPNKGES